MRTFSLKDGAQLWMLDDAGSVSAGDKPAGKWGVNTAGQIVIRKAVGGESALDVEWYFDHSNHLCLGQGGAQVFDFHELGPAMPDLHVERALLVVKPDRDKPFQFSLKPAWRLNAGHDLEMTMGARSSTIDGFISDPRSAFRFNFVDKLEPLESYSFLFEGEWHNEPTGEDPGRVVYEYAIEGAAESGKFELPNRLAVNPDTHFLAYSYDKKGRTRSVQLVGQFSFSHGELTYTIERKESRDGNSTTLRFDATVGGHVGSDGVGEISFALLRKSGSASGSALTIASKYTGRFRNGTLVLGFSFSQQTMTGTGAVREFVFSGELQHTDSLSFAWAVAGGGGATSISIAASNLRLGAVTADTQVTVKLRDGSIQAVQAFVGFTIPGRG
jgi:hypothetical protein